VPVQPTRAPRSTPDHPDTLPHLRWRTSSTHEGPQVHPGSSRHPASFQGVCQFNPLGSPDQPSTIRTSCLTSGGVPDQPMRAPRPTTDHLDTVPHFRGYARSTQEGPQVHPGPCGLTASLWRACQIDPQGPPDPAQTIRTPCLTSGACQINQGGPPGPPRTIRTPCFTSAGVPVQPKRDPRSTPDHPDTVPHFIGRASSTHKGPQTHPRPFGHPASLQGACQINP
jgi:hypothetical protein